MTASNGSAPLTTSYRPADRSAVIENDLTMRMLLERVAHEVPHRIALVDGTKDVATRRRWTYAELLQESHAAARMLLEHFDPGETVIVFAPNSARWVVCQMAAGLAGLVLATANPAYGEREVDYVLRKSGAVGIIVEDVYRGTDLHAMVRRLAVDVPAIRTVLRLRDWDELVSKAPTGTELPEVDAASPAQIQYTGGTTGFPKGVLLHHRGICNTPSLVLAQCGMREGDVWLNAMPLFHVGGCVTTGLGIISRRGTHVVVPEFDPALILELVESERANIGLFVPTMLIRLLDHPDLPRRDLSSVHTLVSGAAPVPAELIRRTKATFDCSFTNIYGQTEVSGVMVTTTVDDTPEDQAETIGHPVPQVEVKIAGLDGKVVPLGVEGEICGRGHQMMIGYLHDPEATAHALDEHGWLHTGDLGTMDERGYLRITGRLKEMIIRGGENISPREVEDVIFEHPEVAEVAVVGVPDEQYGEIVAAVVRLTPSSRVTEQELREHCRAQIAKFKVPARWFFVSGFPITAAGKIQKFALRDAITNDALAQTSA